MANNDILSEFSAIDINQFKKDFTQLMKVGAEIDRYYGEAQHDLDTLIPNATPRFPGTNPKFPLHPRQKKKPRQAFPCFGTPMCPPKKTRLSA